MNYLTHTGPAVTGPDIFDQSITEPARHPGPAGIDRHRPGRLRRALLLLMSLLLVPLLVIPPLEAQEADSSPAAAAVNINRADAATLAAGLNGIGLARAEEIVRYREAYGPFTSIEELMDVKGIGPATLDRNRAVITLE